MADIATIIIQAVQACGGLSIAILLALFLMNDMKHIVHRLEQRLHELIREIRELKEEIKKVTNKR